MREQSATRKQAIIRMDEDLMAWITAQAKSESKSFNAYVVEVFQERRMEQERALQIEIPTEFSPRLTKLCGILKPFSKEEIDADPRLEHILRHHE